LRHRCTQELANAKRSARPLALCSIPATTPLQRLSRCNILGLNSTTPLGNANCGRNNILKDSVNRAFINAIRALIESKNSSADAVTGAKLRRKQNRP